MEDRRQRFRRQLAQLEGAGSPLEALEAGLYVPRPTSSERTIRRIELEPCATRVLTGPIGSGKSTELFVIAQALEQLDELWPVVIDVSEVHDLAELQEGSLVAAAGIWLLDKGVLDNKPMRQLREFAYGTIETLPTFASGLLKDFIGNTSIKISTTTGHRILEPPSGESLAWKMAELLREAIGVSKTPILLFDSLDRVRDSEGFRTVLERDAAALVAHGFGVILTAPVDTVWRNADELRTSTKSWDTLPYEDPRKSPEAFQFLIQILERRLIEGMVDPTVAHRLVDVCGGVLRDLIDLARSAVEEAYMNGHDTVRETDADAAIARLARSLSLGLDGYAISTLLSVHETQNLDHFSVDTLKLLKNRQIIEHYGADPYFEVHPVLQPTIERHAAAS